MKDAEQMALANYASIKAKANQLNASKAYLTETKTEYLPDLNFSAQQDYGTVNRQFGPSYGYQGLGCRVIRPGVGQTKLECRLWSLYLANVNWDFFAFGRAVEKVKVQQIGVYRDETDLAQEQFQHQVRVACDLSQFAWRHSNWQKRSKITLTAAIDLQKVVVARVKNGLNPGVDSSQANAEVSNARIALTNAQQTVLDQSNQLAQYLGVAALKILCSIVFL